MNYLLVGAGQLGSRHLQALGAIENAEKVFVIEPSSFCRDRALERWNQVPEATSKELVFCEWDEEFLRDDIELAVVATPAIDRLNVVKKVAGLKLRYVLCEKVLFQSVDQFDEAIRIAEKNNIDIYVNHIYRYCGIYEKLRELTLNTPFKMSVKAGDNGMGCNLIHFVDLFEYLSGECITSLDCSIDKPLLSCKRGSDYIEFTGTSIAENSSGSQLISTFRGDQPAGPEVYIELENGDSVSVDEVSGAVSGLEGNEQFEVPRVSLLTTQLASEIANAEVKLPTIQQSYEANRLMLNAFNRALGQSLKKSTLCPIT